jgi:hypothetical protein
MSLSPQDEERLRKEFIETAHTVMSISSYADWWLARMKEERARLVREVEGMKWGRKTDAFECLSPHDLTDTINL